MDWSIVMDGEGLDRVCDEWKTLASLHATDLQLFQTHSWVAQWWTCFESDRHLDLRVVVGRSGGELVVVWPLVRRKAGPVRLLEAAGGLLSPFDDVLAHADVSADAFTSIWPFLERTRGIDALRLRGVHERSRLFSLLGPSGLESSRFRPVAETTSPYVDCEASGSFDAHWAKRSKRFRSEQRRSWRLLQAEGAVAVTNHDTRLSLDAAAELALQFKRRWLAENGLSGKTIASVRGESFMRTIGDALLESGEAEPAVSTVRIDDRVVAVGLSYRFQRRRYEYLGGFDYSLERCGPGRVQLETSLRSSFESGLAAHDFMTPSTPFKSRIADEDPVVSQYVIPVSMRGALYRDVYIKRARPVLKRMYNRVMPALRRRHG
ncbi:MAG: GNAT family N-acetyltransferase [Planctomycetes bacterium]|nr:GNAT family N-acetyltransferase [Planctomycetota bacterium]